MKTILIGINDNWIWLGPLLCVCFGVILIALVSDLSKGFVKEIADATDEWREIRAQGNEIARTLTDPHGRTREVME